MLRGVEAYADEVRTRRFPGPEHTYGIAPEELERFRADLADVRAHAQAITSASQVHWPAMSRLSQIFAPKEREFFDLFEEAGTNAVRAAGLLEHMLEQWPDHGETLRDVVVCEQEGDRITHDIIQRLNQTFVTPFDREDIIALASGLRRHRRLHRGGRGLPRPVPDRGADGAGAADGAGPARGHAPASTRRCPRLRTLKDIHHYMVEVNRLENEGDRILREAVASLFDHGIDPMMVIRWKDIYERLEDAIDCDRDRREHHGRASSSRTADRALRRRPLDRRRDGARVRLHERLPRHRELDRDLGLDARDVAARWP